MAELETEVMLLKKELHDQAKIHDRLDVAIEKLTDVSNSIHRMLSVQEEKIARQEDAIFEAEQKIEETVKASRASNYPLSVSLEPTT